MKSRLFICGDSFVDWYYPKKHWTDYLKEHYDVTSFGKKSSDNISIIFQLGNLPEYKEGDRIIIYWSTPRNIQRIYRGPFKKNITEKRRWFDYSLLDEPDRIPTLEKMMLDNEMEWKKNGLGNQVKFIKKLKGLLSKYDPIFVTWNALFHYHTSEFTDLIEVTSIDREVMKPETIQDMHPGEQGCYDIYKILLDKLGDESALPKDKKDII